MAFQHELSWSASRSGTFATCKRRYYYDYYLSWLGWDRQAEADRKQAYLLKKMTRMPMLAGDLVHEAIERWLRAKRDGHELTLEDLTAFTTRALREGYKTSRDGKWKARPAKLTHLAEHHYQEKSVEEGDGSAAEYGKRFLDRMNTALATFMGSSALEHARSAPGESFLACEDMSTFERFGTKIYAVPDFAFRDEEGLIHVYDWKTGKPNPRDEFQLAVYVEYAVAQWDADPEAVRCYDAYLKDDELTELKHDEHSRAQVLERMRLSMEEMATLHFDAGKERGNPESFPMVEPGRECATCNYRELCDR